MYCTYSQRSATKKGGSSSRMRISDSNWWWDLPDIMRPYGLKKTAQSLLVQGSLTCRVLLHRQFSFYYLLIIVNDGPGETS